MKCEIILDANCEERVVIYARRENTLVKQIQQLTEESSIEFIGYNGKEIIKLEPSEIYCVTIIDGKIFAICEKEQYQIKDRLYVLEKKLPDSFVKINQSCIANFQKIGSFDASISGTLKIRFKNGYTDYVSRRQLKLIKERIGI